MTDLTEIARLELAGHRAWPALESERVGGWLCKAAAGVTRRSNSINPDGPPEVDLHSSLEAGITWLAARGLPPIVRVTDLAPAGLDELLTERGLSRRPGARIMTRAGLPGSTPDGVVVSEERTTTWTNILAEQEDRAGAARPVIEQILDAHPLPTGFAMLADDDGPVAVGLAVVDEDLVGIFNMRTRDEQRRRGHGAAILDALLAYGRSRGATQAFLQVHPANAGAIALYERAGFARRYDYWYWQ